MREEEIKLLLKGPVFNTNIMILLVQRYIFDKTGKTVKLHIQASPNSLIEFNRLCIAHDDAIRYYTNKLN